MIFFGMVIMELLVESSVTIEERDSDGFLEAIRGELRSCTHLRFLYFRRGCSGLSVIFNALLVGYGNGCVRKPQHVHTQHKHQNTELKNRFIFSKKE